MPTYLLHGFRWQRDSIRMHIILNDLEDAAPGWVMAPATSMTILNSFYTNFDFLPPSNPPRLKYDIPIPPIPDEEAEPKRNTLRKGRKASISSLRSLRRKNRPPDLGTTNGNLDAETSRPLQLASTSTSISSFAGKKEESPPGFNEWSVVKLVEQYDPSDMLLAFQPYAYVADYMVEITLSASLKEEMVKYEEKFKQADWPLSSPTSPADAGRNGESSSSDVTNVGLSAREARRKSRKLAWFEKLRDALQKEEDIGWHVVYCGDEERASVSEDMNQVSSTETEGSCSSQTTPRSSGFMGFFRRNEEYN